MTGVTANSVILKGGVIFIKQKLDIQISFYLSKPNTLYIVIRLYLLHACILLKLTVFSLMLTLLAMPKS